MSREWLSGKASRCQREDRGFESRLPLHFLIVIKQQKNLKEGF